MMKLKATYTGHNEHAVHIAPMSNPHARTQNSQKKKHISEREIIIQQTMDSVAQRTFGKKILQQKKKNVAETTELKTFVNDMWAQKNDQKSILAKHVTDETESIKILKLGFLNSYIDFIYLTTQTTPCVVQPTPKLEEEYERNKRKRKVFQFTENILEEISEKLCIAEDLDRKGQIEKSLKTYRDIAKKFEDDDDYCTSSYFHQKCLDISKKAKYAEGEARGYMGLGICEENVLNIQESIVDHETALEKALDFNLHALSKDINKELLRVYKKMALEFEGENDFNTALDFYEKCQDACKRAQDARHEAECYHKMGLAFIKVQELEQAVFYINKFLAISNQINDAKGEETAYKLLAEIHKGMGNIQESKKNLQALMDNMKKGGSDTKEIQKQRGIADASLKLGLLAYEEDDLGGAKDNFQTNFDSIKEMKNQLKEREREKGLNEIRKTIMQEVDSSRINIGITKAFKNLDRYKDMIMKNPDFVLKWKIDGTGFDK